MDPINLRQRVLKPIVLTADNFAGNTELINELISRQGVISPEIQARLDTLQRLVHVEGPLTRLPDTTLRDIFDHFTHGGIDDFSMTMWQNLQFGVKKWDGKPATFLDGRTNQEIQVSRFGYDSYRQNAGKQITVAALPRSDSSQDVDYYITFGGAGNKNRQSFTLQRKKALIDGMDWQTFQWGIWNPIHRRNQGWDCQENSNVIRAVKAGNPTPRKSTLSNTNDVKGHGTPPQNENEEQTESDTESESDREWAALQSIRARAGERATRKRVRRSSSAESNTEAIDIPHIPPQPPKQRLRIVFRNSRTEGLLLDKQSIPDIQPPEPTGATSQLEVEVIDLEETESELEVDVKAERETDADTIEVQQLPRQEPRSSTVPNGVENNVQTVVPKKAPSEDVPRTIEAISEVEIQFCDSDDQVQETVRFDDCSTASELFDYACACETADRNTRMLEVRVGSGRPARIMRDKEDQFRLKVVQPVNDLLRAGAEAGVGVGTGKGLRVMVKKYY